MPPAVNVNPLQPGPQSLKNASVYDARLLKSVVHSNKVPCTQTTSFSSQLSNCIDINCPALSLNWTSFILPFNGRFFNGISIFSAMPAHFPLSFVWSGIVRTVFSSVPLMTPTSITVEKKDVFCQFYAPTNHQPFTVFRCIELSQPITSTEKYMFRQAAPSAENASGNMGKSLVRDFFLTDPQVAFSIHWTGFIKNTSGLLLSCCNERNQKNLFFERSKPFTALYCT